LSLVKKRSVAIRGHRTSFSLEEPFFRDLEQIARERGMALAALVAEIDAARPKEASLSSSLRLHVLAWAKRRRSEQAGLSLQGPEET
jgi:predicted DNA-binding ribbon-helix-helix protein